MIDWTSLYNHMYDQGDELIVPINYGMAEQATLANNKTNVLYVLSLVTESMKNGFENLALAGYVADAVVTRLNATSICMGKV